MDLSHLPAKAKRPGTAESVKKVASCPALEEWNWGVVNTYSYEMAEGEILEAMWARRVSAGEIRYVEW